MLRTIGLTPVCTGLRGSAVAFSGVQCRGIGSSHAVWPFRPSLIVPFDETGLASSPGLCSSKRKGFLVNSSARGDMRASISSAACRGTAALGSFDWISVCSFCNFRCSLMFGDENLVRMAFPGVERKVSLGVRGVAGALGCANGVVVCAPPRFRTCFAGELLWLSTRGPANWNCFDAEMFSGAGDSKMLLVCAVPSRDAKPLKV